MSWRGTTTTSSMSGAPVPVAEGGDARERGAVGVHAVVRARSSDEDPAPRLALDVPVAAGELRGGVDRIRAAGREEDDGIRDRRRRGEALGEPDGRLHCVRPERGVRGEALHLVPGRVGDLGAAMPDRAVPEPGRRIDVAAPRDVLDEDALARAQEDLGIRHRMHVRERVPQPRAHRVVIRIVHPPGRRPSRSGGRALLSAAMSSRTEYAAPAPTPRCSEAARLSSEQPVGPLSFWLHPSASSRRPGAPRHHQGAGRGHRASPILVGPTDDRLPIILPMSLRASPRRHRASRPGGR